MSPFSQLGTALLGVYGWDDPGVQRELGVLLTGPLEQAEALIERDLKRTRTDPGIVERIQSRGREGFQRGQRRPGVGWRNSATAASAALRSSPANA